MPQTDLESAIFGLWEKLTRYSSLQDVNMNRSIEFTITMNWKVPETADNHNRAYVFYFLVFSLIMVLMIAFL